MKGKITAPDSPPKFAGYHVGVAAEAFAAGVLAQAGYDVLVQYGANQPLYDLAAVKGERALRVSVKGSTDGSWGLTQSYKKERTYHGAADEWLKRHGADEVFFLVQFNGVRLGEMPRIYVARAKEIAAHLRSVHLGRGDKMNCESA